MLMSEIISCLFTEHLFGTVPEPVIARNPNQPSYYPGENVTLICMVEALRDDKSIIYRWNFSSIMQKPKTFHTNPILQLVPHPTDDGVYTCYANTDSTFTIESEGGSTALKILRKYK